MSNYEFAGIGLFKRGKWCSCKINEYVKNKLLDLATSEGKQLVLIPTGDVKSEKLRDLAYQRGWGYLVYTTDTYQKKAVTNLQETTLKLTNKLQLTEEQDAN